MRETTGTTSNYLFTYRTVSLVAPCAVLRTINGLAQSQLANPALVDCIAMSPSKVREKGWVEAIIFTSQAPATPPTAHAPDRTRAAAYKTNPRRS